MMLTAYILIDVLVLGILGMTCLYQYRKGKIEKMMIYKLMVLCVGLLALSTLPLLFLL